MRRKRKKSRLWMLMMMWTAVFVAIIELGKVPVQAKERGVSIDSCNIQGGEVVCKISAREAVEGDDGQYYLYANEVYQDGLEGKIVAWAKQGEEVTFRFPLNYNTPESNLGRKFLVAVKQEGKMVQVSNEHYITNPEVLAAHTTVPVPAGIKGILPEGDVTTEELSDLGVEQVVYNMMLEHICAKGSDPGAILFAYNGQNYYFNGSVIHSYDELVRKLNLLGIRVTMVLLNGGTREDAMHLVHPQARGGDCPGYAINVEDAESVNHLKAIGAFLGQRYSGKMGCGQIDNWILGNEVNARTSWWYTDSDSLDFNVSIYVKAFRLFYNELKGMNANVRLYNSLDQEWNRKSNPGSFLSKDYLDSFNTCILREGNIDWGLSFHPYNSPLYDPYAWRGPAVWVKKSIKTPYITMQNLEILTDYMHRKEMLNPSGEVRSISLAEIGYTSSFGTENQEASIVYGYLKAASLEDIDAFMLFRQRDHEEEMKSYLALGLIDPEGNRKPAYQIYKDLGTINEETAKARASRIIGMDIDEMIERKLMWTRAGDGVVAMNAGQE